MPDGHTPGEPARLTRSRRARGWLAPAVLAAAALSAASGFAQFAATATLADVAAAFGHPTEQGTSAAETIGLAGTTLGLGLAVIRLASLGALPLAELADRRGRRLVLLRVAALGLGLTAVAALAPGFWVFVAILALGRPLLSAVNAVSGVVASEETDSRNRSKALALIAASYGTGAGLTALLRSSGGGLEFRVIFALSLAPLFLLPLIARPLHETDRYRALRETLQQPGRRGLRLGHVPRGLRGRLALLAALAGAIAFVSGPVTGLIFVYAEAVVGLAPSVTAMIVLAAAPLGLAGLLVGRWAADHLGRRPAAAASQTLVGLAGVLTYRGGSAAAIGGYLLSIFAASAFAPAGGALAAELFPTSSRATAAGWLTVAGVLGAVSGLVVFGALVDAGGFALAALVVGLPVALTGGLYLLLPETRGMELEESAPESA
jgi:MFS family permease